MDRILLLLLMFFGRICCHPWNNGQKLGCRKLAPTKLTTRCITGGIKAIKGWRFLRFYKCFRSCLGNGFRRIDPWNVIDQKKWKGLLKSDQVNWCEPSYELRTVLRLNDQTFDLCSTFGLYMYTAKNTAICRDAKSHERNVHDWKAPLKRYGQNER